MKVIKALFHYKEIGKSFGFGIIYRSERNNFLTFGLVVSGCLKTLRVISLALNRLAIISYFFSYLKRFSFTDLFSAMVHILLARENNIFVKK